MRRIWIFTLVLLAGMLCAGCVPWRVVTSPGASGMVVDAQTHAPVLGAQIAVCRPNFLARREPTIPEALTNVRPPKVFTSSTGRFSIGAEHQWALYPPLMAEMPATGELIITHDGYEPVRMWLTGEPNSAGGLRHFLTGDITNLTVFSNKLKMAADPMSAWLKSQFSKDARAALGNYSATGKDAALLQSILVAQLNRVIDGPVIYETNRFREVQLRADTNDFMDHERRLTAMAQGMDEETYRQTYPGAATPAQIRASLNRRLLEDAYPNELSRKLGSGYYRKVGVVLLKRAARPGGSAAGK